MKQRCLFISLLALMASVFQLIPVQAQNQFAIYNYRNDGDFNAWLDSDVEKITYSNTDLDGVEHENIVVQEVWTSDSIYRIPLETVDSIAFNAPKPVMREGVFYLRGYHGSHTLQIDSLTIYFDTAISRDSLPSVGQTVLSQSPTYPYDGGFAGKAVDISFSGQYVKVVCCRAEIADIFKRLVLVGKAVSEDDSSPAHSKALARKMSGLDDMDIKTFTLGDINFSALNGIASMKSKKPKAVCSYYVYIDELFYKISANVNLIHHDISYTVKINNEILQRLDTETYSLLYELMNNDLLEDEEREELEESLLEEEWKKKIRLFEVPVGPVVIYLEGALSCKIGGKLEASYTYSTHVNQYMSFEASGPTIALLNPYSATLGALGSIKSLDCRFDEDESYANEKFSLKLDGSVSLGGSLQLGACLWSDKVLHICAGGEGGLKLNATLDINLDTADFDTEEDDVYNYPVWYGLTKDTKATAELYAKVKGEIGITPSKFLTLKGDYQPKSWKKELGTVYLFPHFTKPMLPQVYQMGQWEYSPLSLRSIPSNNLLFSSKLGMVITDSEKKQLYYTPQNQEYVNEEEWIEENDAMTVSVANLEPGSYYCYPAFCLWGDKLWKAGPYTKIEVPKPIEVSSENVTVGVGSQKAIPFTGGWGNYSVAVQDKSVCTAELKQEGDSYYIQIVGKKDGGSTSVTLKDLRSQKTAAVLVSVTNEVVQKLIKVEPTKIDFGVVPVGTSKTEHFTVSNVGTSSLTFRLSEQHSDIDIPESGKEFTLTAGDSKIIEVVFTPTNAFSSTGCSVRIFSDADNGTQYINISGEGTGKIENGDFSLGTDGFTSDYIYVSKPDSYSDMWSEGRYAVGKSPKDYHARFINHGDHTTGTGNMLIVNGSTDNNKYVWKKSFIIKKGVTYEFSAWFLSVSDNTPLDKTMIEYNINGVANKGTYDKIENDWVRYYWRYTAPESGTIEIKIRTMSSDSGGNDFAIDDIFFSNLYTFDD